MENKKSQANPQTVSSNAYDSAVLVLNIQKHFIISRSVRCDSFLLNQTCLGCNRGQNNSYKTAVYSPLYSLG